LLYLIINLIKIVFAENRNMGLSAKAYWASRPISPQTLVYNLRLPPTLPTLVTAWRLAPLPPTLLHPPTPPSLTYPVPPLRSLPCGTATLATVLGVATSSPSSSCIAPPLPSAPSRRPPLATPCLPLRLLPLGPIERSSSGERCGGSRSGGDPTTTSPS
jgi:hypothetical protein